MFDKNQKIDLTFTLADAICDLEDIRHAESACCENTQRDEAWQKLVDAAEQRVCRVTHAKRQPAKS